MKHKILITGGLGFIGSHLIKYFVKKYPDYMIYNIDKITYAANIKNVSEIKDSKNYKFIEADICDFSLIKKIFIQYEITSVINLAAESHVDRSIENPILFAETNVIGTINLLKIATNHWSGKFKNKLFYQVSTDEVYGALGSKGSFVESSKYKPNSPYSASKASADHFVNSFAKTYNLPVIISNCSNNYGTNQFSEKLIPLVIFNTIEKKPIPIYGNGQNVRDWIHVNDHVSAIDKIFHFGKHGENYNIGGANEYSNLELVKTIIKITDVKLGRKKGSSENLIEFVKDRNGHDFRYSVNCSKLINTLGWNAKINFKVGLENTILWYINNYKHLK